MEEKIEVKKLPLRSEIKIEDTWRLEDIFPSDEIWEKEYNDIKNDFKAINNYKGRLSEGGKTLYEGLSLENKLSERVSKLYVYAHLKYDQDTTNSFYQGLNDKVKGLLVEFLDTISFITPELLGIDERTINDFFEDVEGLKLYTHFFNKLNLKKPHVLSEREEGILAKGNEVLDAPSSIYGILSNADLTFPTIKDEDGEEVEITQGRYIRFLESNNQRVRKDAFNGLYETYGKFKNTFAATLSNNIKKDNFYAKVRNFDSARHSALSENNIPEKVYDNLIDTIHNNLGLLHRYVKVRKKILKLDELHMYDLYTPLVEDVKMEIKYEEAKDILVKALEPLGEDYIKILEEGFNSRWVDVRESKGKRSGAYSSGSYNTNPYILMNWQDNVNNLFTLAHEFGHSIHSYYTRKNQPYIYGDYSIFVAEVASTCNEALLNHYLLETIEDKKERLYILNHFLEGFRGTVFRQTMFAEFEHEIHKLASENVPLTAQLLTDLYYNLNKVYFGEENIIIDKEIGLEWARIPHFYYNYYVYQYATGYSAAAALSKRILEEGQVAVDDYLDFLKAGNSNYPIEVLKKAGVDMTSKEPIEEACKLFEKILDEIESLLDY